jgi:hypothetical protein
MPALTATVSVNPTTARLLITDPLGDDLLKARLPLSPRHPRALLTLLEGASLWAGSPLCAAICAAGPRARSLVGDLFGGAVWPPESALVHFDFVDPARRRRRRLRGMGDFRQLYLIDSRRMR